MQTSQITAFPGAWKTPGAGTESASSPTAVGSTTTSFGSARHAIMRVVAAQVLGALTSEMGGLRGLRGHHEGGEHRAHGPAAAVAQSLQNAIAQGADPQALLGKVQEGIENAQTALTERGFDPAQVAAAASQFTEKVASLMDAPPAETVAPVEEALAASVQISRKERGSLVLTTQDGDVLRIRFRNSERQSVDIASVTTADAQATSVQVTSHERSKTRVEVEGSLDAGELKAIEDFVAQVDTLANEFFEGDVETAFAAAASLNYDASEIAGFSLKLSMSEKVQASAVQRSVGGAGSQQPAALPPAASDAPTGSELPPVAAAGEPVASGPSTAPQALAAGVDPMQMVQDFMQRVLRTADAPLSVGGFKLAWSAKVKLAAEVVSVAVPPAADKPGAALLSNTIDSAASQAGADAPQVKLAEAA